MTAVNDVKKVENFVAMWNQSPFADIQNGATRYGEIEANYQKLAKKLTNHPLDEIVVNKMFASEQSIPGLFYNIELTSNRNANEFVFDYAQESVEKFGLTPTINTVQLPCLENKTADVKTMDVKADDKIVTYANKANQSIENNYPFYIGGALIFGLGAGYLFFNRKKGKR